MDTLRRLLAVRKLFRSRHHRQQKHSYSIAAVRPGDGPGLVEVDVTRDGEIVNTVIVRTLPSSAAYFNDPAPAERKAP